MTQGFDEHIRSGENIGEDRYIKRLYWTGDGEVGLPADRTPGDSWTFIGVHEHHKRPDGQWCGGYVHFKNVPEAHVADGKYNTVSNHELVSENPLTVAPSLQCRSCPSHGFIREGRWESA